MGVFNKINQRSGVVSLIVLGSLILFLVGADFFSSFSFFSSSNKVGEIDGSSISREEYSKAIDKANALYGGNQNNNLEDIAWSQLINDKVIAPAYSAAGFILSDAEKTDLIEGENISPIIAQQFQNKEGVKQFIQAVEKMEDEAQRKEYLSKWASLKDFAFNERVKAKYETFLRNSEYVTKAEAERFYHSNNDKAEIKYVYVPYASIVDSTIKVEDKDIENYISKHKNEFKVEDGRSLTYAIFNITPTSADSAVVKADLEDLKAEFASATNDTAFIRNNSEGGQDPSFVQVNQLPDALSADAGNITAGQVYGPFPSQQGFSLTKVIKVEADTNAMVKASHILFMTNEQNTPEEKAEAKQKALSVLAEIKAGANFAEMAAKYGTDGTKDRGGDLGWFGKGQMVKPFETACFGASKAGLLPNLVETQFGYHIVKVDVARMARKFFVASVNKPVVAYENTIDSIYKIADEFLSKVSDTATFNKEIKNFKGATQYSQPFVEKSTRALTSVTQAREIINWLYNDDRDINDTKLFTVENNYVVALYTEERPKGTATVNSVRDQVKPRVLNELKADKIKEKLKTEGALEAIAKAYGKDAVSNTVADLMFGSGVITGVGYEPEATGVAFGLVKGKRSQVIVGESGVLIIEKVGETPSTIADYNQFVKQIEQQRKNKMMYGAIEQALRYNVEINDFRYRY